MRKSFLIVFILITGCEDYMNNPYIPFTKKYKAKTRHEKLSKTIFYGDGDFSSSLNSYMSGPTAEMVLAGVDSPAANCVYSDYNNIDGEGDGEEDQMNGFPLSISDKTSGSIKGEPQVIWDECKGIKSNYDDGAQSATCKKRKVSKEFINFFDDNFAKCVQLAADGFNGEDSEDQEVESIKFSHAGISGDPRHSNKSYHSVNRAMDIRTISFKKNGKTVTLKVSDQKKSPAKEFFKKFRKCWSDQIVNYKSNCPGKAPKGSIGHEHRNHQHHLHLSLPYCPRTFKGNSYYHK